MALRAERATGRTRDSPERRDMSVTSLIPPKCRPVRRKLRKMTCLTPMGLHFGGFGCSVAAAQRSARAPRVGQPGPATGSLNLKRSGSAHKPPNPDVTPGSARYPRVCTRAVSYTHIGGPTCAKGRDPAQPRPLKRQFNDESLEARASRLVQLAQLVEVRDPAAALALGRQPIVIAGCSCLSRRG